MSMQQHKVMLAKVLLAIAKDPLLTKHLIFKGGTCALFFYGLPRMSVDLDFDLVNQQETYIELISHMHKILMSFGTIRDHAEKHWTLLRELDYAPKMKNMKIEISKRTSVGTVLQKNFLGENLTVMSESSLFAHKLVALLNRSAVTNRDIFDIRYFLQGGTNVDNTVIQTLVDQDHAIYLRRVKDFIDAYDFGTILYGLGELIDESQKQFCKKEMKAQMIGYMDILGW